MVKHIQEHHDLAKKNPPITKAALSHTLKMAGPSKGGPYKCSKQPTEGHSSSIEESESKKSRTTLTPNDVKEDARGFRVAYSFVNVMNCF